MHFYVNGNNVSPMRHLLWWQKMNVVLGERRLLLDCGKARDYAGLRVYCGALETESPRGLGFSRDFPSGEFTLQTLDSAWRGLWAIPNVCDAVKAIYGIICSKSPRARAGCDFHPCTSKNNTNNTNYKIRSRNSIIWWITDVL